MRAARTAAFFALSTPTVATGTPGGIWTIESNASRPSSTDIDERSGTPITGRSVCAATTPGSAAASPAPQISTLIPRPAADRAYSATASGVRCAERTSNSQTISRASSSSSAACMRARSDSEPTRMPTHGSATCHLRYVASELGAAERHPADRLVRQRARLGYGPASCGDRQDPPAVCDEAALLHRRPAVEHERPGRLGGLDPADLRAGVVTALRVVRGGNDDVDGRPVTQFELCPAQLSVRGPGEHLEEVPFEKGHQCLRLGVTEACVELEHARPVGSQHQPCEQAADERRASPCELIDHGPAHLFDERVHVLEPRHGSIGAHAARVRADVAVADALEVLRGAQRNEVAAVAEREQ